MSDRSEELQRKLEERREQRKKEEDAQEVIDLEARLELEDEHGTLGAVRVPFKKGFPLRAFVRAPSSAEYKRYKQTVQNAGTSHKTSARGFEIGKAQELLAKACWVYPGTPEARGAMEEQVSGILTSIAVIAIKLAEGEAEEEGKG